MSDNKKNPPDWSDEQVPDSMIDADARPGEAHTGDAQVQSSGRAGGESGTADDSLEVPGSKEGDGHE